MKSWFHFHFHAAAADDEQEPAPEADEEGAPLVAVGQEGDEAHADPAPAAQRQSSKKAWWAALVSPTRGAVGVVIGGLVLLALLVVVGTGGATRWIHLDGAFMQASFLLPGKGAGAAPARRPPHHVPSPPSLLHSIPFSCANFTAATTGTCRRHHLQAPSPSPSTPPSKPHQLPTSCPDYFRHIHSDLAPWRETGITRVAVESAQPRAAFRLVVVGGRAYVETYHRVFQTRDLFTQWGILQLLARYPGRVPDLDLMFNCEDMPEVRAADYPEPSAAPPLFRYCKDGATLDIVFPDWSFWGWPEVNVRPWAPLMAAVARENARLPWRDREPYAYWKGNPGVSPDRGDLFRCDAGSGVRAFRQDWAAASRNGFRDSDLAGQCRYRYKIYVRGRSWSVSEKYILACDSPMLAVDTPFSDFFSRGLVAGTHYWPIDRARKCGDIKFAVEWGNAHPAQARRMAEAGSGFAREEMSMDYVYDYMLHVLTEYAALLRYRPTVPEKAVELCPEALACPSQGRDNKEFEFMMESRERFVAGYEPCTLPPAFTSKEAARMARREQQVRSSIHQMEMDMQRQH